MSDEPPPPLNPAGRITDAKGSLVERRVDIAKAEAAVTRGELWRLLSDQALLNLKILQHLVAREGGELKPDELDETWREAIELNRRIADLITKSAADG